MQRLLGKISSASLTLAVSFVLIGLFILFRWLALDRDFTSFVCLPESRIVEEVFNKDFRFQDGGYDGIYFYTYAHDPLAIPEKIYNTKTKETVYQIQGVIQAKNYPFRKKRIGYSAATWLTSGFGKTDSIPVSLVLVNFLAFMGLVLGVHQLFSTYKVATSWALFSLTFVGAYVCVARDLADLLGLTFGLWAFVMIEKQKVWSVALLTLLAIFTKENIAFFIAIPMIFHWFNWVKERFIPAVGIAILWSAPFLLYIAWNIFLKQESSNLAGYHSPIANFTWPFYGIATSFNGDVTALILSGLLTLSIYCLVVEAGFDLTKRIGKLNRGSGLILGVILIVYFIISICFSYKIYEDHWSLGRNLLPLQMSAFLWLIWSKGKISKLNLAISLVTMVAYYLLLVLYP